MRMKIVFSLIIAIIAVGCGDDTVTYSLLPEQELFEQQSGVIVNQKLDILWVIDNSGSMKSSQESVANNFSNFIDRFSTKGYDYRIAVTTTAAYQAEYTNDLTRSKFRDGTNQTAHSGVYVITPDTPDLINIFMINIIQGTSGTGDERGLQSMRNSLDNPLNTGFLRSDAFLSVIFVTDEEDFSHDGSNFSENPATAHPVQNYINYLDSLTTSTSDDRKYSASTIGIFDEACRIELNNADLSGFTGRKIAARYAELTDATDGVKGSLCDNFALTLDNIAEQIVRLSTQFHLSRVPIIETITVYVDGQVIPNNAQDGWQYNTENNSIMFFGSAVPSQGQKVKIDYDPSTVIL